MRARACAGGDRHRHGVLRRPRRRGARGVAASCRSGVPAGDARVPRPRRASTPSRATRTSASDREAGALLIFGQDGDHPLDPRHARSRGVRGRGRDPGARSRAPEDRGRRRPPGPPSASRAVAPRRRSRSSRTPRSPLRASPRWSERIQGDRAAPRASRSARRPRGRRRPHPTIILDPGPTPPPSSGRARGRPTRSSPRRSRWTARSRASTGSGSSEAAPPPDPARCRAPRAAAPHQGRDLTPRHPQPGKLCSGRPSRRTRCATQGTSPGAPGRLIPRLLPAGLPDLRPDPGRDLLAARASPHARDRDRRALG